MLEMIKDRMPTFIDFVCMFLAFFVPYITYKVNKKIHKMADPPWKKEEKSMQQ